MRVWLTSALMESRPSPFSFKQPEVQRSLPVSPTTYAIRLNRFAQWRVDRCACAHTRYSTHKHIQTFTYRQDMGALHFIQQATDMAKARLEGRHLQKDR